jgi:hypothetical protein
MTFITPQANLPLVTDMTKGAPTTGCCPSPWQSPNFHADFFFPLTT